MVILCFKSSLVCTFLFDVSRPCRSGYYLKRVNCSVISCRIKTFYIYVKQTFRYMSSNFQSTGVGRRSRDAPPPPPIDSLNAPRYPKVDSTWTFISRLVGMCPCWNVATCYNKTQEGRVTWGYKGKGSSVGWALRGRLAPCPPFWWLYSGCVGKRETIKLKITSCVMACKITCLY